MSFTGIFAVGIACSVVFLHISRENYGQIWRFRPTIVGLMYHLFKSFCVSIASMVSLLQYPCRTHIYMS